jgi:hypothetical protein
MNRLQPHAEKGSISGEILGRFQLQPVTPEEAGVIDNAFGLTIPKKGGEVPASDEQDNGEVNKQVTRQVGGTRSKIVNTVGIVMLSGLSFLAAENIKAQSAPPSSQPVATSSAETGQKQEKIDPWHIVVLADGSQTKIVKMKDGRYILGVIMPDGKKLKGELETKDPQEAEKISIAYIKSYNALVMAEQELSKDEQELSKAEQELSQAEQELAREKQALNAAYKKADQLNAELAKKMEEALNQAIQKTRKAKK